MSTPQPPSSGDRPDEADLSAPVEPTAEPAVKKGPAPRKPPVRKTPATSAGNSDAATAKATPAKTPAAKTTAAKTTAAKTTPTTPKATTPRTTTPRKRASKPAPPSPVGEAPGIMDATLGTSTPLAGPTGAQDTSTEAVPASVSAAPSAPSALSAPVTASAAVTPAAPVSVETATASTGTTEQPSAASTEATTTAVISEEAASAPASDAAAGNLATEAPGADAPPTGASQAEAPQADARGAEGPRRTVVDFADRLDDSRFFSALFDFTFTSYVTRRLAGPVYVVGLVLIALGILVGFSQSLAIAVSTQSPAGAFAFLLGVLVTLVAAVMAVLLLRVGIEVFVAIIEIAQNTRGRRRPPRD